MSEEESLRIGAVAQDARTRKNRLKKLTNLDVIIMDVKVIVIEHSKVAVGDGRLGHSEGFEKDVDVYMLHLYAIEAKNSEKEKIILNELFGKR